MEWKERGEINNMEGKGNRKINNLANFYKQMAVDSVAIYKCVRKRQCMLHLEPHAFKVTINGKIVNVFSLYKTFSICKFLCPF